MPDFTLLEFALRGGVAALVLLFAVLVVRRAGPAPSAWLGAAFSLGVAAYAFCSAPGMPMRETLWLLPLLTLCAGNSAVFWLFAESLFDDEFRLAWWQIMPWAGVVGLSLAGPPLDPGGSGWPGMVVNLTGLVFVALALRAAITGWHNDLVPSRRLLRGVLIGVTGGYAAIVAVAELILGGAPAPAWLSLLHAAAMLATTAFFCLLLLRLEEVSLFLPAPVSGPAPEVGQPEPTIADPALMAKLRHVMEAERFYREEDPSIGRLAARLGLPEHRLRRVINRQLGYRNFTAFLNDYRLADVKAALADPGQAEVPVLTIALDAGFQSLGPFNRAFKAATGMTPTAFRRRNLGPK